MLFACSSTERVNSHYFSDTGYAQGFVSESFTQSQFIPVDNNTKKKALGSDHQLMMSLLNRSMTTDQAMMLAFAQQRANYSNAFANYTVEIKGDKSSDEPNNRSEHTYAKLISQDINAVSISAPK